jgi:hypothetical protein
MAFSHFLGVIGLSLLAMRIKAVELGQGLQA